ncbi:MAG TPA: hypothetical protein VL614_15005 [Acetobacteraceae bacterium]|jgi:hypothetical protein|nr:hypothetical protein [Acetobacteraceae bacterium]
MNQTTTEAQWPLPVNWYAVARGFLFAAAYLVALCALGELLREAANGFR